MIYFNFIRSRIFACALEMCKLTPPPLKKFEQN